MAKRSSTILYANLTMPFVEALPPLSVEEKESLRIAIQRDGVLSPCLATQDGRLLDGHNRLDIDPDARILSVPGSADWSDEECLAFIWKHNRGRRNLSPDQKREQREKEVRAAHRLRERDEKAYTQPVLAELFGVDQSTVSRWFATDMQMHNGCEPDARVKVAAEHHPIIWERCEEQGETQEQVAADYGVTRQAIAKIIDKERQRRERESADWTEREVDGRAALERGETVVVNVDEDHRLIAWARQQGLFVQIDRQTQWGNPFVLDDDGDRDEVIRKFATYYLPHKSKLLCELSSLKGKAVGCHCAPLACHGDILARLAEGEERAS